MELKKAGIHLASVSLDHWNPAICEKIRNHPSIQAKQVAPLRYLNEIGVKTYALPFLNQFLIKNGVEKLV